MELTVTTPTSETITRNVASVKEALNDLIEMADTWGKTSFMRLEYKLTDNNCDITRQVEELFEIESMS